jgi:hypothetical protein
MEDIFAESGNVALEVRQSAEERERGLCPGPRSRQSVPALMRGTPRRCHVRSLSDPLWRSSQSWVSVLAGGSADPARAGHYPSPHQTSRTIRTVTSRRTPETLPALGKLLLHRQGFRVGHRFRWAYGFRHQPRAKTHGDPGSSSPPYGSRNAAPGSGPSCRHSSPPCRRLSIAKVNDVDGVMAPGRACPPAGTCSPGLD